VLDLLLIHLAGKEWNNLVQKAKDQLRLYCCRRKEEHLAGNGKK
jgi:hypothetical protein